ncbi:hypothetical protein ACJIZ3_019868 [Penstemon smallii]|uniref:Uncharacterized protein n=1 Tax=Penstemon smallii TaxID=265156 RepID=A0ABD3T2C9_9LAMI
MSAGYGSTKISNAKNLFFDTIEIGSSIALFCFGFPKSIVAEGIFLTRGDDNGLCKNCCSIYVNMEDV